MECTFHVGQKVAAISNIDCGISKGDVFTISRVNVGSFRAYDGAEQTVSLEFVERSVSFLWAGFDPRFFRPIVTRKTDISIFQAMLTPKNKRVPA